MSIALYNGRSYRSRAWFLKKLGFASYAAYLKTPLWAEIRERVFKLKGRSCHLCGRFASQAHHTRYHEADLAGRKTKYIHPICGRCHKRIEFTDGEKNTVARAKQLFKRERRERKEREHLVRLFDY